MPPRQLYLEHQLTRLGLARQVRQAVSSYELAVALAGRGLGCALLGMVPVSQSSIDGRPITTVPLDLAVPTFSVVLARAGQARLGRRADAVARAMRHAWANRL